jgi:hypothetical protein
MELTLFIRKIYFSIILLASDKPSIAEKIQYWLKLIATSAPVVLVLDYFDFWYKDNSQFFNYVLVALILNMIIGIVYHVKMNTFSWGDFFMRNISMFINVLVVYVLLDMLRNTAGNNIVGESFKVLIQVTTLLYPISKTLKNIYILNQNKFPPAFIMERLYNFEKNGNLDDLFNKKDEKTE